MQTVQIIPTVRPRAGTGPIAGDRPPVSTEFTPGRARAGPAPADLGSLSGAASWRAIVLMSAVIGLVLGGWSEVRAQGSWTRTATDRPRVNVEWTKAFFDGGGDAPFGGGGDALFGRGRNAPYGRGGSYSVWTSMLTLSAEVPVSERASMEFELPYLFASVGATPFTPPTIPFRLGPFGSDTGHLLGNPYVGLHLGDREGAGASIRAGAHLPFGTEFGVEGLASVAGLHTRFLRYESVVPDLLSLTTVGEYRMEGGGWFGTVGGGGVVVVPVGTLAEWDSQTSLLYSAGIGTRLGPIELEGELRGRVEVASGFGSDEPGTGSEVSFTLGVPLEEARPALHLAVPIDRNPANAGRFVVGIGIEVFP